MSEHDLHERHGGDVAAYALGALDPGETEAFERHLLACAVCRDDLGGYCRVVDGIAESAPTMRAPRSLRRAVMGDLEERRPVSSADAAPASRRPERRRRFGLGVGGVAFSAGLAFAIAAVVVAVIALPGRMANRTVPATVAGRGTAKLVISGGHAEIVARHLSPPPHGKIYELWLQRSGASPSPTSVLFGVDRHGDASVDVPGSLYRIAHVLVTPEPAGGSRHPTHAPVISVAVRGV